MTVETVIFIAIGAGFAGFVNGLAGFGTSLFALGWWLQVMPPTDAVALALVISLLSGFQGVLLVRHAIEPLNLARFLLPALIGIPIGTGLLDHIEASWLQLLIAVFLLTYGAFFSLRKTLPTLSRPTPIIDGIVGFLGGILGALAGLSGALPTVWLSLRAQPKARTRALLQPFSMVVLCLAAGLLAVKGAYNANVLIAFLVATPISLAGAQIGIRLFKRLHDADFRRLLIILMFLSGAILLVRTLI
jgi:uncharacterized membrane protein YfcA